MSHCYESWRGWALRWIVAGGPPGLRRRMALVTVRVDGLRVRDARPEDDNVGEWIALFARKCLEVDWAIEELEAEREAIWAVRLAYDPLRDEMLGLLGDCSEGLARSLRDHQEAQKKWRRVFVNIARPRRARRAL